MKQFMDSESCTEIKNEEDKQKQISNDFSDDRDVPKSLWIRRTSGDFDRVDRFLLECELGLVLPCGILLYALFLLLR
jgi:hypothetical protein